MSVLKPVRSAPNKISSNNSLLGHIIPNITCTLDFIRSTDVPIRESELKYEMLDAFSFRLGMLLDTEKRPQILGGKKFLSLSAGAMAYV